MDTRTTEIEVQAIAGDRGAMDALWRHHRVWVQALLRARCGPGANLDDVLSETALTFVQKIGQLKDPKRLRGWLRQVALNSEHEYQRRVLRREGHEARAQAGQQDLGQGKTSESLDRTMDAIGHLPLDQREVLLLRACDGLSMAEIAEVLETSDATAHTRLARARKALRNRLGMTRALGDKKP